MSSPFISRGWKSPWMVSCHVWWISLPPGDVFHQRISCHNGWTPWDFSSKQCAFHRNEDWEDKICVFKKVAPLKRSTTSAQWNPMFPRFFGQSQQKSTRANANDLPTHLVAVLAQLKFIPILPIISVTHRSIIDPSDDWLCQAPNLNDHSRR